MSLSTRSRPKKKASPRSSGRGAEKRKTTRAKTSATTSEGRTSATPAPSRDSENKYFVLRSSPIQGRGAFATRPIRRGTRIIEYTGEVISHDEADKRYDDGTMGRHHTFLFSVSSRKVIDAAVGGNEARFINHSCAPNCEAQEEDEHIWIIAVRDIKGGEELSFNYGYDLENYEEHPCRCGASKCLGYMVAEEHFAEVRRLEKKRKN